MGLTIKVPIKELETRNTGERVEEKLKADPTNAYSIAGLMVEVFGIKESQIRGPFRDWLKKLPTLYSQINVCLIKLKKQGLVKSSKHGKAWVYWWAGEQTEKVRFKLKGNYS